MESIIQDPEVQAFRVWQCEAFAKGYAEGLAKGLVIEARRIVHKVLAARGLPETAAIRTRIQRESDVARLEAWVDAAATATMITDVFPTGNGSSSRRRPSAQKPAPKPNPRKVRKPRARRR